MASYIHLAPANRFRALTAAARVHAPALQVTTVTGHLQAMEQYAESGWWEDSSTELAAYVTHRRLLWMGFR